MPLVKIDYVVSFSSEDPENPASNLLLSDVKSKWLCSAGEPSCSIVLQLKSACKIDTITIGAYHVALIEVLVGLSEKPHEPFEVLVPSCVLLSPGASRRGEAVECVRSFGASQLARAAERRWDRVRLVCSQPYNKHCKYGLAFVHISSAEGGGAGSATGATPLRALQLDAEAGSSDDEFRPGELFARHRRAHGTDAQIRQASSQALKNNADASTKLTKTFITKPTTTSKEQTDTDQPRSDRRKESLLYTDDDNKPHAKIDRVVQRHHDEINKKQDKTDADKNKQNNKKTNDTQNSAQNYSNKLNITRTDSDTVSRASNKDDDAEDNEAKRREKNKTPQRKDSQRNASSTDDATASRKKRKRTEQTDPELSPVCASVGGVLAGAVVAISGYVNPQRAALRSAALEMGAHYLRDWDPSCTHLICAFPNTPKLRAVRASGAATVAVLGAWLEQCRRRRRRLPWRWFATEPAERVDPATCAPEVILSDGDTDDEIEKVLKRQSKKLRRDSSPERPARDRSAGAGDRDRSVGAGDRDRSPGAGGRDCTDGSNGPDRTVDSDSRGRPDVGADGGTAPDADETLNESGDSDVAFVRDSRVRARLSVSDSDATDEDERGAQPDSARVTRELPQPWARCTFALSRRLAPRRAALLARYIRAYGGLVLQEDEVQPDSSVQYVVEAGAGAGVGAGRGAQPACGARRVTPAWVWRQHARLAQV